MKRTFFFLLFISYSISTFSQGLSPQQQMKVDSLLRWMQMQSMSGKTIDQSKLDSINATIRAMNESATTVKDTAIRPGAKEITKQSMAGSSFTVPKGKIWVVKHVYVNDGGSYNILVSFKANNPYKEGDKLFTPSYSAEAELLSGDMSSFSYIFKIEESDASTLKK